MPRIIVYKYRYFNRKSGSYELSDGHATEKAIKEIGAEIAPSSAKEVDARLVSQPSGFVIVDPKSNV